MSSILPDTIKPATLLSRRFRTETLPSLAGRVVVVTGGSSGIGFYDALALAKVGATVIIISANEKKGKEAEAEINKQLKEVTSYGSVTWYGVDLTNLKDVDKLAKQLASELERLDIFIANAGIGQGPYGLTDDGLERHFEVCIEFVAEVIVILIANEYSMYRLTIWPTMSLSFVYYLF